MNRGSNDLLQPLERRVRSRLDELKMIGYDHFQKGDDGEHHLIPAEIYIAGAISKDNVKKIDEEHYKIRYRLFQTEKGKDGLERPIRILLNSTGEEGSGAKTKVVNKEVIETFKKGKPFTRSVTLLETNGLGEITKDPHYRQQRKELLEGGPSTTTTVIEREPEETEEEEPKTVINQQNPTQPPQ